MAAAGAAAIYQHLYYSPGALAAALVYCLYHFVDSDAHAKESAILDTIWLLVIFFVLGISKLLGILLLKAMLMTMLHTDIRWVHFVGGEGGEIIEEVVDKAHGNIVTGSSKLDPFSRQRFRQASDGTLYSVGPDRKDNLGKVEYDPMNGTFSKGDILIPEEVAARL